MPIHHCHRRHCKFPFRGPTSDVDLSFVLSSTHLSVALAVVADDLEGGEVAEDLVGRRVRPDPVLVVDDLPVAEPDFLLRLRLLRRLQSNKVGDAAPKAMFSLRLKWG